MLKSLIYFWILSRAGEVSFLYVFPPILTNRISIHIKCSRIFLANLRFIIKIIDKTVLTDQYKIGSYNRVLIISNILIENTNWLKLIYKDKSGIGLSTYKRIYVSSFFSLLTHAQLNPPVTGKTFFFFDS